MKNIAAVFTVLFLAGCATTTPFQYQYPELQSTASSGLTMGYAYINDLRADKEIDKIYETSPIQELDRIFREEIASTGLFKEVVSIPLDKIEDQEYLRAHHFDLIMKSSLIKMNWEVPGYDSMLTTAFVVSVLTGGIGGIIYGTTSADVNGDTKLMITLIDPISSKALINKEYVGHVEERKIKFKMDTNTTKAEMVGKSVKVLMEQFKKDLVEVSKNMKQ